MLKIENLQVNYGVIKALHGITLSVKEGESVALIGSNGAGKSTLLKTISGLIHPSNGDIVYNEKSIIQSLPGNIVDLGICHVPEGRRIFYSMSVKENLEMGAFLPKNRKALKTNLSKVFNLFPRLYERQKQKGGTLSGGEQQMLAIGRALMSDPKLLLLDEPSLGLAPVLVENVYDAIQEVQKSGTSILLVEQNAYQALTFAQRGYVIETGNIILEGSAKSLLKSPKVKEAFLG
ncbi:MAG: ABC transporter ATP-binding protein [Chloroflexota bacterium]|nr:ABC transporter ATP-binding protein [Chloroflexota bacterium]